MEILIYTVIILVILIFIYRLNLSSESFESGDMIILDSGHPGPILGILAGMHGNEPAAVRELINLIQIRWFKPKRGSIRIIPAANKFGLAWNTRNNWLSDMNRQFPARGPTTKDAQDIVKFFEPCDVVIDFHEGWGFHQISPESLGSTIMPNSQESKTLSHRIVQDLNGSDLMRSITAANQLKSWVVLDPVRSCEIPTTLSCYYQRIGRNHILVETTGQNDIQPLEIRREQVRLIITSLLQQLGIMS